MRRDRKLPGRIARLLACSAVVMAAGAGRLAAADPPVQTPRKAWRPVGKIQHPALTECSGIVASRQHPGIFWVHNDSGHQPILYAVKESGELVAEVPVAGATNIDWEDIAADDQGHLYIADTGNNYKMFPVRSIYQVEEPDPYASPVKPARVIRQYKYTYPGERFDCEALFVRGDRLWIVSKSKRGRSTVYRIEPSSDPKYKLVEVARLPLSHATGADLSADGKHLAVCTLRSLRVFSVDDDGVPADDEQPRSVRYPAAELEACCFDGDDIIVATEAGAVYRIPAADLAAGTRFVRPGRLKSSP